VTDTQKLNAVLERVYNQGFSASEIASALGLRLASVRAKLVRAGVYQRERLPPIDPEEFGY
jgi:DNA-directed RNA polymerase specialized sigma24 family protein